MTKDVNIKAVAALAEGTARVAEGDPGLGADSIAWALLDIGLGALDDSRLLELMRAACDAHASHAELRALLSDIEADD